MIREASDSPPRDPHSSVGYQLAESRSRIASLLAELETMQEPAAAAAAGPPPSPSHLKKPNAALSIATSDAERSSVEAGCSEDAEENLEEPEDESFLRDGDAFFERSEARRRQADEEADETGLGEPSPPAEDAAPAQAESPARPAPSPPSHSSPVPPKALSVRGCAADVFAGRALAPPASSPDASPSRIPVPHRRLSPARASPPKPPRSSTAAG